MTGKYPFVLGRLAIELNHNPLLENNVVLTLHYAMEGSPVWVLLEQNDGLANIDDWWCCGVE